MDALLLSLEIPIRLGSFFTVLAVMATWELAAKRRPLQQRKPLRWTNNLALTLLDNIAVRAFFPVAAVGAAEFAAARGIGFCNAFAVPYPATFVLSLVALDGAIYLQHRLFHAVPLLWRLHRVHHSIDPRETNSNFGFNLPWWDHLFGTCRAQPAAGHDAMTIGIGQFRDPRELWLDRMLLQPFRSGAESQAIGRERDATK